MFARGTIRRFLYRIEMLPKRFCDAKRRAFLSDSGKKTNKGWDPKAQSLKAYGEAENGTGFGSDSIDLVSLG